ncbi:MAG: hypothetical protein R2880_05075 [Deinococcales bacterium]
MFAIWQELLAFQQAFNVDKTGIFETLQMSLQQIASHGDGLKQHCGATVGFVCLLT